MPGKLHCKETEHEMKKKGLSSVLLSLQGKARPLHGQFPAARPTAHPPWTPGAWREAESAGRDPWRGRGHPRLLPCAKCVLPPAAISISFCRSAPLSALRHFSKALCVSLKALNQRSFLRRARVVSEPSSVL